MNALKSYVVYHVEEVGSWGGYHPCYTMEELKSYVNEHKDTIKRVVASTTSEVDVTELFDLPGEEMK